MKCKKKTMSFYTYHYAGDVDTGTAEKKHCTQFAQFQLKGKHGSVQQVNFKINSNNNNSINNNRKKDKMPEMSPCTGMLS